MSEKNYFLVSCRIGPYLFDGKNGRKLMTVGRSENVTSLEEAAELIKAKAIHTYEDGRQVHATEVVGVKAIDSEELKQRRGMAATLSASLGRPPTKDELDASIEQSKVE